MLVRILLAVITLAAVGARADLPTCKENYSAALAFALTNDARCKALIDLAKCINDEMKTYTHPERLSAQGFFDAAKLTMTCAGYNVPVVNVGSVESTEFVTVKVPSDSDINVFREQRTQAISIWDLSQKFKDITKGVVGKDEFAALKKSVAALQANNMETVSKIRDDILDMVDTRLSALNVQIKAAMDATFASLQTITASMNDVTLARVAKMENDMKSISATASVEARRIAYLEVDAINASLTTAASLTNALNSKVGNLDVLVTNQINNTLGDARTNADKLWTAFGKAAIVDPTLPVFRYNVWHTYSQNHGWYCSDNPLMFGGVNPSTWTDNNGYAYQMSSDKNVLRTLFNKKIFSGWNANVQANEWYYYSSTNGQVVGALFRIRNTQSTTITWKSFFYFSSFASYAESASVALNGVNMWTYSGTCGFCTINVDLPMPPNRISTAIFIATSGGASGTRTNLLVFYNDCLKLPTGLEYVDDLDYATGGWEA